MLDPAVFRNVMGRFASGVSVITLAHDGRDWGMTLSALCSVSLDPPTVLICTNRAAPSGNAVAEARHFAINILGVDQRWIAEEFAQPSADKFTDVLFSRAGSGDPLLADCIASMECQVVEELLVGSHRVLIAEVLTAQARDEEPLAYFRGTFGRFELAQHADAYRLLFDTVVERALPLDEPLDPTSLADRFALPTSAIVYGLTRLIGDGLVTREPELGYRQVAFDPSYAIDCYEAKRALDHAVARLTVGRTTPVALDRLRTLCSRANTYVDSDGVSDVPGYRAAALAFQEGMIGLAQNRAITSAVRRLRIPELVSIPQAATRERAREIAGNRERIVQGYEEQDLAGTLAALDDQADLHVAISLDLLAQAPAL